jgi:hypothetical protein
MDEFELRQILKAAERRRTSDDIDPEIEIEFADLTPRLAEECITLRETLKDIGALIPFMPAPVGKRVLDLIATTLKPRSSHKWQDLP